MKYTTNLSRVSWFSMVLFSLWIAVACSSTRAVAAEEGWEILGERKVDFISDKDEVVVNSRNQFTAIKFRVEEKEVRINELKVEFDNGDKLAPALDLVIPPGQDSRVIELASEGRTIKKIEFKYRSTGNVLAGRAIVLVFGKRSTPQQN